MGIKEEEVEDDRMRMVVSYSPPYCAKRSRR